MAFWTQKAWLAYLLGKVKISSTDTTIDYLINKLVAGTGITITQQNMGSDEDLLISSTSTGNPPGGSTNSIQYNNSGAFGGFGDYFPTGSPLGGTAYVDLFGNGYIEMDDSGVISISDPTGGAAEIFTANVNSQSTLALHTATDINLSIQAGQFGGVALAGINDADTANINFEFRGLVYQFSNPSDSSPVMFIETTDSGATQNAVIVGSSTDDGSGLQLQTPSLSVAGGQTLLTSDGQFSFQGGAYYSSTDGTGNFLTLSAPGTYYQENYHNSSTGEEWHVGPYWLGPTSPFGYYNSALGANVLEIYNDGAVAVGNLLGNGGDLNPGYTLQVFGSSWLDSGDITTDGSGDMTFVSGGAMIRLNPTYGSGQVIAGPYGTIYDAPLSISTSQSTMLNGVQGPFMAAYADGQGYGFNMGTVGPPYFGAWGGSIQSTQWGVTNNTPLYLQQFGGDIIMALGGGTVGIGMTTPAYEIDIYDINSTGTDIGNSTTSLWKILATGEVDALKFVTSGGASSDFVKGDGSLDSSTYLSYKAKGSATLVSGTKAITISGLTTSNQAFVTIAVTGGTLGGAYKAVCTTNTLTITSVSAAGTTVTTDTSTLNYLVL